MTGKLGCKVCLVPLLHCLRPFLPVTFAQHRVLQLSKVGGQLQPVWVPTLHIREEALSSHTPTAHRVVFADQLLRVLKGSAAHSD